MSALRIEGSQAKHVARAHDLDLSYICFYTQCAIVFKAARYTLDNFRIVRMDDMKGTNWTAFGHYGSGTGEFINPCGLWGDGQGRIYVADQGNDRIVRIDDMNGTNWTAIGSFGTRPEPGKLYAPCGVCVDSAGRIYVSESSSNSRIVRMDDMDGTNWTVFGTLGAGVGQFASPMGIFVR